MRNSSILLLVAMIAGGGWLFLQNFDIEGLENIAVKKKAGGATFPVSAAGPEVPAFQPDDVIKIATFNIQVFGQSKLSKPKVMAILARLVREFDVIAVQEIRSQDQDVMPRFIEIINAAGRSYDFVIGPRIGDTSSKEQYAYIFDRQTIEVDRTFLYTVNDPDNLLHREPLVGWFRARGPSVDEAFTFTLVNVHTDPDIVATEMSVMDDVYRVVRDDGRDEDDVIILGDFNADSEHLGELGQISGITWAISGLPTNVRRTEQYDNIIFHRDATKEFVGRSGVVDFMRDYNLSTEEALEVSDHLPVWAEFSIYEGGTPGYVASRPSR
ncbi:MAG: endonuclease/exonuclease/phosphatase family protein [Planctomycetales bacterium]|nr:endonuclease/exonuclease/phosphatase family protein [Planctomycetales bacterium]